MHPDVEDDGKKQYIELKCIYILTSGCSDNIQVCLLAPGLKMF